MSHFVSRSFEESLQEWYLSPYRKPLVLRGARQTGKSTIVKAWAKAHKLQLLEVNLEKHGVALNSAFLTKEPAHILTEIQHRIRQKIHLQDKVVLFLDEIQGCPNALAALRYFYEEMPSLPVVCAGSLLEFTLADHNFSMPVGRIEYRFLAPFTFREFLVALQEHNLLGAIEAAIQKPDFKISTLAHERLLGRLSDYFLIGGMPECVAKYAEGASIEEARRPQFEILGTYRDDFPKYAKRVPAERLHEVLDAAPRVTGRKLKYAEVNRDIRSRDIKAALNLLVQAGLYHKIYHSSSKTIPLAALENEELFKLIFLDIGLLNSYFFGEHDFVRRGDNTLQLWNPKTDFERIWLGKMCEQFVGQSLVANGSNRTKVLPYYWLREGKTGNAELDFVTSFQGKIIPIEVKAGHSGTLKSLHTFMAERDFDTAIRFDASTPSIQEIEVRAPVTGGAVVSTKYQCISLPLYFADWMHEVLKKQML
jgi:predicted AAA+ superfamily ATPase